MELVARTRETAQSQPLEAMVGLQVRKAHFDALALIARSEERFRLHLASCEVAGILVNIAQDATRWHVGAALGLERARSTIGNQGIVADRVVGAGVPRAGQRLPGWADINVLPLVPDEVCARECSVVSRAPVPDRDVGCDPCINDEGQELTRAVSCVSCQPLRLQIEAGLGAVEHRLGGRDLVVGAGRCRLHIDDYGLVDVDQIVEPVAELHALVGFGGPGRGRIGW